MISFCDVMENDSECIGLVALYVLVDTGVAFLVTLEEMEVAFLVTLEEMEEMEPVPLPFWESFIFVYKL